MPIDPEQPTPLYFQLKTALLEQIRSGRYPPGGRLPTEHELCERYGLSRTPVTRALSELAQEGVVRRARRRGTFVNPDWVRVHGDLPVVHAVVPPGPWAGLLEEAAAGEPLHLRIDVVEGASLYERPSLYDTLRRAVAEGRGPDLALLDSVWAPEFAAAGFLHALEDLDDAWLAAAEHDLLPPLVATSRFEGRTYGVSAFGDVAGLWCRLDHLGEVGAPVPASWGELRAIARALADRGRRHPIALPGGVTGAETTTYCLLATLASNRAYVLGTEGVTLGRPGAGRALRFLQGLVQERLMSPEVVGYTGDQPARLLAQGKASFSFGGSYEAPSLARSLGVSLAELPRVLAFVPVPAGPAGAPATVVGTAVYAVFRQSAQPRLALDLIARALAAQRLAKVAQVTGRIPSRRSAVALAAPALAFVGETAVMLEQAATRPATPVYPRVSVQLQEMLEAVLGLRLGPAAAVRRTAELVAAITGLPVAAGPLRRPPRPVSPARP